MPQSLDGLNNSLFLTVLAARMSKIKVLAGPVSGEDWHPGPQTAVFFFPTHRMEKELVSFLVSSPKNTNPIYEVSSLLT